MVIGFRCSPDAISLVLLDGTRISPNLLTSEVAKRPADLSDAAFFSWVRKEVTDLLRTNRPKRVALKRAEHGPARSNSTERRAQLEAVAQAASYDCGFHDVGLFNKAQIASALSFNGKARDILDALDGTPLQDLTTDELKEAALAAWCLL
jgi:hypothetical protein